MLWSALSPTNEWIIIQSVSLIYTIDSINVTGIKLATLFDSIAFIRWLLGNSRHSIVLRHYFVELILKSKVWFSNQNRRKCQFLSPSFLCQLRIKFATEQWCSIEQMTCLTREKGLVRSDRTLPRDIHFISICQILGWMRQVSKNTFMMER